MIIKKWLDQNILSLNISKTKYMPLSLSQQSDYALQDVVIHSCGDHQSNTCNCKTIDNVPYYKYLGVIFDFRLKWSEHIEFLKKNIRKYLFAFKQLRAVLKDNEIKLTYFAYVQSVISFGIIAWGAAYKTTLNPLLIAQKSILKVAFNKPIRYPTDSLFSDTSILSIRHLFIKNLLIHIHKNFNHMFTSTTHTYNTRYSINTGINAMQLVKAYSATNPAYVANVLFRNIITTLEELDMFQWSVK